MKPTISDKLLCKISIFVLIFLIALGIVRSFFVKTNELSSKDRITISKLNKSLDKYAKNENFDGCVLVVKNGKILLEKGYGFSDKESKIKNTVKNKFLIGSITKQFTAVAIMQLQQKGLLNVNDTIDKYISGIEYGDVITIHELLTHTSGLSQDLEDTNGLENKHFSLEDAVDEMEGMDIKLLFQPGSSYSYSNLGYMLLSYIVEKVSGNTYENYIDENIFKPLNMDDSGFGYDNGINKELALGYDSDGKVVSSETSNEESRLLAGAGEIYSTVEDLYKWDRALYTEKIVSKSSLDKIYTSYQDNYGYGWNIVSKNVYEHGGTMSGFSSCIKRLVGDNSFIVVLSNDLNSSLVNKIDDDVTNIIAQ